MALLLTLVGKKRLDTTIGDESVADITVHLVARHFITIFIMTPQIELLENRKKLHHYQFHYYLTFLCKIPSRFMEYCGIFSSSL